MRCLTRGHREVSIRQQYMSAVALQPFRLNNLLPFFCVYILYDFIEPLVFSLKYDFVFFGRRRGSVSKESRTWRSQG